MADNQVNTTSLNAADSARHFRVVMKTWENGRLMDQQTLLPSATFEQASTLSRRLTGDRVRLNNQDVTVSVESVIQADS